MNIYSKLEPELDIPDITQEEIEELCCYKHGLAVYIR